MKIVRIVGTGLCVVAVIAVGIFINDNTLTALAALAAIAGVTLIWRKKK